jgi:signal transduction histidine kinase
VRAPRSRGAPATAGPRGRRRSRAPPPPPNRVADTGIGIPGEEQDALFQKFFRASTAQDLAIQGTGPGLSIVAGIVAVHGGRITVDSEPGRGTRFQVRLPLPADHK